MQISIASYSFHRLLQSGKQDMFGYIADCKRLGCTQLDPWSGHLGPIDTEPTTLWASPDEVQFTAEEDDYLKRVRAASDEAGLPFGCIGADGPHIYDDNPDVRQRNRAKAYRWMRIAKRLGANQIRLDAGGTPEVSDAMYQIIIDGYHDLLARTQEQDLELLTENHWGATKNP